MQAFISCCSRLKRKKFELTVNINMSISKQFSFTDDDVINCHSY